VTATFIYDVPDISCEHCQHAIEGELSKVPGVSEVTVAIDDRTVTVHGDASDADIQAAIVEAGYDVAAVRVQP
jgi:copper chaperone